MGHHDLVSKTFQSFMFKFSVMSLVLGIYLMKPIAAAHGNPDSDEDTKSILVDKNALDSAIQETTENKVKLKKQKSVISKTLSPCSFMIEEAKLEPGPCTHSGACRFQGYDYMYQGGCGQHSGWGSSIISTTMECSMMVTRSREVQGKCTRSGHCWNAFEMNLFHKKCRRMLS